MNAPETELNLALAERYMQALEACDVAAVRKIYAPDARLWHNVDQALQPVEDNLKLLQWVHRRLANMRYEIVRREPIPGGFYQQHELRGTLPSGEEFAMPACAIVKIQDGRIASLDEYLDSAKATRLLSAD